MPENASGNAEPVKYAIRQQILKLKISMNVRAAAILLLFSAPVAWAECAREDIQFYLDKGFTTEQVTQLCAGSTGGEKKKYRAYTEEYVDRQDREYQARMRLEREAALRNAIEATDIRIERGYLYYIRPQCVSEGVEKDRAFGLKSCPNIRYRIKLAGLEIDEKEYKKRFLFGQRMVRVVGVIGRQEMPGAFADIPDEYWRNVLRKRLEKGNSTKIPLRAGVDFHFARDALQDMASYETERARRLAEAGGEREDAFDDLGEMLDGDSESESARQADEPENEEEEKDLFDELAEIFD